jgi:hypothetical protein
MLPLPQDQWLFHTDGDDIAVCPIGRWRQSGFVAIPASVFLTKTLMREHGIRYGADLYMVGRFTGFDGKQKNTPCLRFGNISMMPQPIDRQPLLPQESFIVEMRSKSGFSGSPVFVYFDPPKVEGEDQEPVTFLLGLDWADLPTYEEIVTFDADGKERSQALVAKINSGMALVVPSWRILELLNGPELVEQRRIADQQLMKKLKPPIAGARET